MGIDRDYHYLTECMEEWGISISDVKYLISEQDFTLSIRAKEEILCEVYSNELVNEIGDPIMIDAVTISGIFDIDYPTLDEWSSSKKFWIKGLNIDGQFHRIIHPQEGILSTLASITVRFKEKNRIEKLNNFCDKREQAYEISCASPEVVEVIINGENVVFSPMQSKVIYQLIQISKTDKPFLSGQILLHNAGSRLLKLGELFKKNRYWRQVLLSDKKGNYRLK